MKAKKLAVFVEGFTEQCFVEKMIRAMVSERHLQIEKTRTSGGGKNLERRRRRIEIDVHSEEVRYFVMILDCCNDDRVQSDIRDNYDRLVMEKYDAIIGLRDVYPATLAEVARFKLMAKYKLSTNPIDPAVILAVMEVEAWFLAESSHFERIDSKLTPSVVISSLNGFNPSSDDVTSREHPAKDLNTVYNEVSLTYEKTAIAISRTVTALSVDAIYLDVADRVQELRELINALQLFFDTAPNSIDD